MALQTMYPAEVNSPELTLNTAINNSIQTIVISGDVPNKLPAAPNIFVIGTGEDAETIYYPTTYSGTDPYTFTGVTRGFQGTAASWAAGTAIARLFTAYDHDTFRANILDLDTRKAEAGTASYAAIVYQDATYTYARDSNGNLLSSVLRSLKQDRTPIQAAIDYANNSADAFGEAYGRVFINKGDYYIQSKITNKFGVTVECLNYDTILYVETDIDVLQIRSHSYWNGGVIYLTSAIGTYNSTAVLLNAVDDEAIYGIGHAYNRSPYVRNLLILMSSSSSGGKGIWIKNEQPGATTLGIFGCDFSDVTITGQFDYSIYFSVLGDTSGRETISWNSFTNVNINNFKRGVYMYCPGLYPGFTLNYFKNLTLQTYTTTHPEIYGLYIDGSNNVFDNVTIMDWTEAGGTSVYLKNTSSKNMINNLNIEYIQQLQDWGRHNSVICQSLTIPLVTRDIELTASNAIVPETNAVEISVQEMSTNAFPVPYGKFTVAGETTERMCWMKDMPQYWDGAGRLPSGTSTYTASTSTSATVIYLTSSTLSTQNDFYNGWLLTNTTRSLSAVVSDYASSGTSKTITLTSPGISGQVSGDTFYLENPGMGRFYGQVSWTSTESSHYDCVKWLFYALRVGDGAYMTTALPLVATFLDKGDNSAYAYGGRTTRLMLRLSSTIDSTADTTHFVDDALHEIYMPSNNTGNRTLAYVWNVTRSLGSNVSSFNDTTHTVTLESAITGMTAGDSYELYVTDYYFNIPGRGDITLFQLKRGSVGDDFAHTAYFMNMKLLYKVGRRSNV